MGQGMNKILPGLYVGNFRDCKDKEQLEANKITHIVSIHDNAKPLIDHIKYLCVPAADSPHQNLSQYFRQCIEFIHEARLGGGAVLVHCLAGMSRSVTVTVAYIMTVTEFGWQDTLRAVKCARTVALPNFGFQRQLQNYEHTSLPNDRKKLKIKYPDAAFDDNQSVKELLEIYHTKNSIEKDLYPLPHNAYCRRDAQSNEHKP
ncbi:dual specificity protein phosphatase 22-like [Saccoglossus kowalevskii]|uniref:Dual specificity protein phosphatase 22-like n=1 Tax=Saccoglossus kowalevskii TaxID=10224 RepID=A0ABM0M2S7_SACKO|nr:PREDICTED: dual specificity protein phosphatase 22-like [Saccoglossus kowalevskii]